MYVQLTVVREYFGLNFDLAKMRPGRRNGCGEDDDKPKRSRVTHGDMKENGRVLVVPDE